MSDVLDQAKAAWLAQSAEEEFFFELFQEPKLLRRSNNIRGALASLEFGGYRAMDGTWVDDQRAVWLSMITSDVPGDGGRLLAAFQRLFGRAGIALIGTPTALKPRDWARERPFESRVEVLICWYMRHGFRVVQNGFDTRVVYAPRSSMLVTNFALY